MPLPSLFPRVRQSDYVELHDYSTTPYTPAHDKSHNQHSAPSSEVLGRPKWRYGVAAGAVLVFTTLVANFAVLGWADSHEVDVASDGSLVVYEGDCVEQSKISFWGHFAINVLSTILLGASSYAMQCLSAPTRAEVDAAHQKHHYLDIGEEDGTEWMCIQIY